jgi:pimeloyl-ACP methyl ester carboxylesterase
MPPTDWRGCVGAVRDALRELRGPLVLVGHSGAGLLLPVIAEAVDQSVSGLIFVDSGVPTREGETPFVPPPLLDEFRALARGGMLPPWFSWFGDETIHELVPDEALRRSLIREMPDVPVSFLEQRVPSPPGWERARCRYLLLSEAYSAQAAEARLRDWPVEQIRAQHLHMVVDPRAVTDALLRLEP